MELKIATLNIKTANTEESAAQTGTILSEIVLEHGIDILFLQEITRFTNMSIQRAMPNYTLVGERRFDVTKLGQILGSLGIKLNAYNESTPILSRYPILFSETFPLRWIPTNIKELKEGLKPFSIMPRCETTADIALKDLSSENYLTGLSTHVTHTVRSMQKKQLLDLLEIIRDKASYNNFVMGMDANLEVNDPILKWFTDALRELSLERVPVVGKTNGDKYPETTAIDHLYVPTGSIETCGIIHDKRLSLITDHKPAYAKINI